MVVAPLSVPGNDEKSAAISAVPVKLSVPPQVPEQKALSSELEQAEQEYKLANDYRHGNGVAQDVKQAIMHYKKAKAARYLSHCYRQGIGVGRNKNKADSYCQQAAALGDEKAQKKTGVKVESLAITSYYGNPLATLFSSAAPVVRKEAIDDNKQVVQSNSDTLRCISCTIL